VIASGVESRMMKGWMKLSNCAASTRNTTRKASAKVTYSAPELP
jgi:hypothetical protein